MTQCLIPFRPVGWYVVPHNAFWRHEAGDPGVLVPASSVRKVRRREPCSGIAGAAGMGGRMQHGVLLSSELWTAGAGRGLGREGFGGPQQPGVRLRRVLQQGLDPLAVSL